MGRLRPSQRIDSTLELYWILQAPRIYGVVQACVFLSSCCHSIAKVCALNSSIIAVNLVAPKGAMGAVNGGSMTLQSGGRALGPLLSGTVWAVVVSLHVAGQQFIGFSLIAVAFVLTQFLYLKLRLPASDQ